MGTSSIGASNEVRMSMLDHIILYLI